MGRTTPSSEHTRFDCREWQATNHAVSFLYTEAVVLDIVAAESTALLSMLPSLLVPPPPDAFSDGTLSLGIPTVAADGMTRTPPNWAQTATARSFSIVLRLSEKRQGLSLGWKLLLNTVGYLRLSSRSAGGRRHNPPTLMRPPTSTYILP
jgi:hypothetical protein